MFGQIATLLLVLIVGACLLFLVLRSVFWSPRRDGSPEAARRHAYWTGFIAWLLSSLMGAVNAGIISPPAVSTENATFTPPNGMTTADASLWQTLHISQILFAIAAVLVVSALGQLTWPAPKAAKRRAELAFRHVRDFTEPVLGWVTAVVFLASAGFITAVFFAPGFAPRPMQNAGTGNMLSPMMGRVPGWQLGLVLGGALLLLALGTAAIMVLTARRRSLESLTSQQNATLRSIGINRLLRVSATVASGLGAVAGNYLFVPNPAGGSQMSVNVPVILNIVVLIVMLLWKPPVLVPPVPADDPYPLERLYQVRGRGGNGAGALALNDSTTAAMLPVVIVAGVVGALLITWLGVLGPVTAIAVAVLLTLAGLEQLLRRNYATPGMPRQPLSRPLPKLMLATLALSLGGLLFVLAQALQASGRGNDRYYGWTTFGGPASYFLVPGGCAAAVTLAGALAAWLVLGRPGVDGATQALDNVLRRRALFRVARGTASGWIAILGVTLMSLPTDPNASPLSPAPDMPAVGGIACAVAILVAVFPVPPITGKQFLVDPGKGGGWAVDGESGTTADRVAHHGTQHRDGGGS